MKNQTQKVWKVGPLSTPIVQGYKFGTVIFFFFQMIKGFNFQKFYNHVSVQQKAATVIQYLYSHYLFLAAIALIKSDK